LVVDRCEETREVLQTVLQRSAVQILATGLPHRGLELARRHHPDLIVLDLELADPASASLGPLLEESRQNATPVVLLGRARRGSPVCPAADRLSKPYHYGPLIRKIEQLLNRLPRTLARSA
jgi:DNA-binding response OmpR family regulator